MRTDPRPIGRWPPRRLSTAQVQLPQLRLRLRTAACSPATRRRRRRQVLRRLLLDAVAIAEQIGADLSRSELRIAFRAEHVAAHDALGRSAGSPRVGRGSRRRRVESPSSAKARTLSDIVAGTLGERWRSDGDESDALIARQRGDLSSTYHALQTARAPTLYATLLRQAADQERELTILQLDAAARADRPSSTSAASDAAPRDGVRRPRSPTTSTAPTSPRSSSSTARQRVPHARRLRRDTARAEPPRGPVEPLRTGRCLHEPASPRAGCDGTPHVVRPAPTRACAGGGAARGPAGRRVDHRASSASCTRCRSTRCTTASVISSNAVQ